MTTIDTTTTCEMSILDASGDTKVIWDSQRPDEVDAARATFDALRAKGYSAFEVRDDGEPGGRLDEFDKVSGRLIMVPSLQGG